ncbi:Olfactory receptor 14J1, partial [Eurypyga helias]
LLVFSFFFFFFFSHSALLCAEFFLLRIPCEQGRHKALSRCLPHLPMVSLLVSTAMFGYLKSPSISSQSMDLVVTLLYMSEPPAVNHLICSMRNNEIK